MPRETGPKKCRAKRDHVERKIIFQPTFSGDMLVFWGVSCSWHFWGCDHEPNQRWAGSLDHLWRIYRDLLRVKKSKSLVLEEVFILAIPKAYQIDSDVKLKSIFFDVIYATTFWQEEPLQISFIPLYCMWLTYLIPEPVQTPAHHLNCCISCLRTINRRHFGISSDWSLSCSNSMASSSSTNAWRWFVWKDWKRSNSFFSKGPWILEGYF